MSEGGWLGTALQYGGMVGDAVTGLAEASHVGHIMHMLSPATQATMGLSETSAILSNTANAAGGTGLGNWLGPLALAAGINNLSHADGSAEGVLHGTEGVLQMVAGGIGTTGLVGAGLNAVGATAAGGALTGAAAAAAPVAAVAGAAAAGLGIGTGMANASDSEYTRTGFWGQDDSGRNRSAMDWGSGWGNAVDEAIGTRPGDWSVLGAGASMAGGIVGGVAGTVQAGFNALTDW